MQNKTEGQATELRLEWSTGYFQQKEAVAILARGFLPKSGSLLLNVILEKGTMTKDKEDIIEDAFSLENTFPVADELFANEFNTVEESFENAIFVLDTNILLLPFNLGAEAIEEIKKIYTSLIDEQRLFIPKRVAREYAKNRTTKLSEIHSNILRLKSGTKYPNIKYPIIADLKEKKELDKALQILSEKEEKFKEKAEALANRIKGWRFKDPVSKLYGDLFNSSIMIDTQKSKEDILKELNRRKRHKIPPGYKDSSKDDFGVGDLIIWLTILEKGQSEEKDIIFVSQDLKPDWWQQSSGSAFLPRFELIEEYKRESKGNNIHIISFSKLLELFKAKAQAIEEMKLQEEKERGEKLQRIAHYKEARNKYKKHIGSLSKEEQIEEIKEWFFKNFENPVDCLPYESKEGGYIYIWGGPYDAREEIENEFGGIVDENIIDEVASELEEITWEWSGNPDRHREE